MQNKVNFFNENLSCHKQKMPTWARLLDTSSELGELAKEILKGSDYGTKNFKMSNDFKMEYGDVLYCLLSLASELEIDADECLEMALEKYKKRVAKNNNLGSGN